MAAQAAISIFHSLLQKPDRARFFIFLAANESRQTPIRIKRGAVMLPFALAVITAPEERWCRSASNY